MAATRSGSTGAVVRPSRLTEVPTIAPSATRRSSPTVSGATPEPTRIGPVGHGGAHAFDVAERRRLPSRDAGDDQRVREPPVGGVARDLLQLDRGERDRVLAAHVDEEPRLRPEEPPVAERPVRVALDHALVRHDRADVDVDPHERGADRRREAEGRPGVVLEHVDADREAHGPPHLARRDGHRRHGGWVGPVRAERRVPEVLHEARVEPPCLEGPRVGHRALHDGLERAAPAGAAGQRQEMDHPDQHAPEAGDRLVGHRDLLVRRGVGSRSASRLVARHLGTE